jgi:hypothetical protein
VFANLKISQHSALAGQTKSAIRAMRWKTQPPFFDGRWLRNIAIYFHAASAARSEAPTMDRCGHAVIKWSTRIEQHTPQICVWFALDFPPVKINLWH